MSSLVARGNCKRTRLEVRDAVDDGGRVVGSYVKGHTRCTELLAMTHTKLSTATHSSLVHNAALAASIEAGGGGCSRAARGDFQRTRLEVRDAVDDGGCVVPVAAMSGRSEPRVCAFT